MTRALLQQALDALQHIISGSLSLPRFAHAEADNAIAALTTALAQPEPEPVAMLVRWTATHNEPRDINPWMAIEIDKFRPNPSRDELPLYLHPAPTKSLTDDQIDAIMTPLTVNAPYSWRAFARAIEAAHGIHEVKP